MTEAVAEATEPESIEESEARGFRGVADPTDRDEYALTSGPESPGLEAQLEARIAELQAQLDESKTNASQRVESAKAKHSERKSARTSSSSGGDS